MLDGTGSTYIVPAILSYASSKGEKNDNQIWDSDKYFYTAIILGIFGAVISYALKIKKINEDCHCQEYKRCCRHWVSKVIQ